MNEKYDIRQLIKDIHKTVKKHELSVPGQYSRWIWQDKSESRFLGVNEYGCADAANILYTIGEFVCDEKTRNARIRALQELQDPETGMFKEATHHTIHTTAHCTAALELFDAKPKYPIYGLHKYFVKDELYALLDGLNWVEQPWSQSHQGAGVYAALVNAGEMTAEFQKNYFEWFWENASPEYGFWKKGTVENAEFGNKYTREGQAAMYQYMAGGFHYMFNHEFAKQPYRYPEKIIDTCIKMYKENGLPENFDKNVDFLQIDWVFAINRASRQTAYRFDEVRELISDFAGKYLRYLCSIDYKTNDRFNDLHCLFGMVCCLAELQAIMPGRIITEKPLKLVLDRRPFI